MSITKIFSRNGIVSLHCLGWRGQRPAGEGDPQPSKERKKEPMKVRDFQENRQGCSKWSMAEVTAVYPIISSSSDTTLHPAGDGKAGVLLHPYSMTQFHAECKHFNLHHQCITKKRKVVNLYKKSQFINYSQCYQSNGHQKNHRHTRNSSNAQRLEHCRTGRQHEQLTRYLRCHCDGNRDGETTRA